MGREAFVTLATNDTYCKGAVVLAQSLRNHNTQKEIVVLITPHVSQECRCLLEFIFDHIVCVNVLDSEDDAHLALLKRPELGVTFTKIHCWNLIQYEKCVFMDADTMVLTNIDELFGREELSAAPDAGWPDMFNSGVFVYKPSRETYMALIKLAEDEGSFDGGDQGLLNTYFNTWSTGETSKRLSFLYNMHSTATYTYSPAFARFGKDTKVVHFIGSVKPWHHQYTAQNDTLELTQGPGVYEQSFLLQWWRLMSQFTDRYHSSQQALPAAPQPCHGTANDASGGSEACYRETARAHHQQWQNAHIDFTGVDRFERIQHKLDIILTGSDEVSVIPEQPATPPEVTSIPLRDVAPFSHNLDAPDTDHDGSIATHHVSVATDQDDSVAADQDDSVAADQNVSITTDHDHVPTDQDATPSTGPPDQVVDPPGVDGGESSVETFPNPEQDFGRWKRGAIDFMGRDSFDNILSKIDALLIDSSSRSSAADEKSSSTVDGGASKVDEADRAKQTDASGSAEQPTVQQSSKPTTASSAASPPIPAPSAAPVVIVVTPTSQK